MISTSQPLRQVKEILNYFNTWQLDPESKDYIHYHAKRYELLLNEVEQLLSKIKSKKAVKILDIGPAYQTELLRLNLPNIIINSLGFDDHRFKRRKIDQHFEFDLNQAQYKNHWPKVASNDIVILAETIEHLYTSPKLVLQMIKTFIKPGGYLIIQTPNAVSLDRRLKMILGKHPYDMIRENHLNPGHFREYTLAELVQATKAAHLKVIKVAMDNYFIHKQFRGRLGDWFSKILPDNFKHGLTLVLKN